LYTRSKDLDRRLGGIKRQFGHFREGKNLFLQPVFEARIIQLMA
jgi:hypothetical protein